MTEHTRTLGFPVAFAIGLGTMIAAGIFSLSGIAVLRIGSTAVVAFVLAAVVAGITAASYSEFASIYSENGGGYLFTSRTFEGRDLLTYAVGMSLFLGYTGTTAFYLATMDEWFFRFLVPESYHVLPRGTFGVSAALLLGVLNARGTEESGSFQVIVTAAKVAVLFLFVGGMFASVGVGPALGEFTGSFQVEPVATVSVAALAFITFFGFSAIAASAGEIIEPRKTVPRAIAASIGTVTVLYALVIVAMVNVTNVAGRLARSPAEILQLGETAMGAVAQAFIPVTVAGVPVGTYLIVAGAIFSMVSASNASILAASGIGSLMGRNGQAPRRFSRIHPEHGTPFWSVASATGLIVGLIVVFTTLFGHHGLVTPVPVGFEGTVAGVTVAVDEFVLGLGPLTGFATLNLLLPLAVVNYALVRSRSRYPDVERGFNVPGVPWVPALGVLANVALIYNLPTVGAVLGLFATGALVVAYVAWGGAPETAELVREVVPPLGGGDAGAATASESDSGGVAAEGGGPEAGSRTAEEPVGEDRPRVLVPVARPSRAPGYVRLAHEFGLARGDDPIVQVLNVVPVPEQTPHEMLEGQAGERATEIRERLAAADVDVACTVEAHTCRDVAFDILETARRDDVDLVVMGYPESNEGVAEQVGYEAPCDVVFASGVDDLDLSAVTVGAGGGPHHRAALPLVRSLGQRGSDIHVVRVNPAGEGGTPEQVGETVDELGDVDVRTHAVSAASVAEGLVSAAADHGGVLVVGASRTRRLRQWVFGSTPDRVVSLAAAADVPVFVYTSSTGVPEWFEDRLFPVYRYLRRLVTRPERHAPFASDDG